jgi:hypothetical protein
MSPAFFGTAGKLALTDAIRRPAIGFPRLGNGFSGKGRPSVEDPAGAASDGEGMRTDRRHVFVEARSPVGKCWVDVGSYGNNPLGRLVDQASDKRRGVFRRSPRDLRINMLRDLFDGENDWKTMPMPSSEKLT